MGDDVLAWSEWKQPEEAQSYEKVVDVIRSTKEQRLVHITLEDGNTITATDGHPFHTPEGWRDAILLKQGDRLKLDTEAGNGRSIAVQSVWTESKVVPVFNLEVANAHTYFVGQEGALVHNGRANEVIVPGGGGINRAQDWFNRIVNPSTVQQRPNGTTTGKTYSGANINVHPSKSRNGAATVEVQYPCKLPIKYRF